jgi:muramoyltetrapeptide carboxypeptidase
MNSNHQSIYCFAPSGRVIDSDTVLLGEAFLKEQGFKVLNIESSQRKYERFAGTDKQRINEINGLASITHNLDESIALSIRGGYGMSRLLSRIDWEGLAKAVDGGLKIVGHSDITSLNMGLFAKTGRVSYAGPMLSYDFGKISSEISTFTAKSFFETMSTKNINATILSGQNWLNTSNFQCEGKLWGGNLSIINSLLSTSYFPDKSLINNGILFLEDINEHPYRIERLLYQLLHAGVLQSQQAIVFGDFSGYKLSSLDAGYDLDKCIAIIKNELNDMGSKTQILNNLPFGHCFDKLTLPIGKTVQINATYDGFELKSI